MRFYSKEQPMIHKLRFIVLAVLSLAASTACADGPRVELQGGRSHMGSVSNGRYGTTAAFLEGIFTEKGMGHSRFTWAPDISLGWIGGRNVRNYAHARYSTSDNVWLLAAGGRFRYGAPSNWYHALFFSFQVAGKTGRTLALSSPYEFVSTLGLQWHMLSLQVRHISNGGFHKPNRGETMGLIGVGWQI
jgi:hypothetical protein